MTTQAQDKIEYRLDSIVAAGYRMNVTVSRDGHTIFVDASWMTAEIAQQIVFDICSEFRVCASYNAEYEEYGIFI